MKFTVKLIAYTPIEKEFEVDCATRDMAIDLAYSDSNWTITATGESLELSSDCIYDIETESIDVEVEKHDG